MWKLENDVNDYVKQSLGNLWFKKHIDFNEESSFSDYMKESLKGGAKTENKTGFGKPDFHIEKYDIPVIIEDKLAHKKLLAEAKDWLKTDALSINGFAVNGAVYYAKQMIASGKYKEVIAIGVAGDNTDNVEISAYYVYGYADDAIKHLEKYKSFHFLENEKTFKHFYEDIQLTEIEKHEILIDSREKLQTYAKKLNKLMHNHNISAAHRVLYVSGMLLAMQEVMDKNGKKIKDGLTIEKLEWIQTDADRDGKLIARQIDEFLKSRGIPLEKRELMLASFGEIAKDKQRDELTDNDKEVAKFLDGKSSTNKQIFAFIYKTIFVQIDSFKGHLDIMGEMYSEFLKYALGDGKEIGIVLTPPYVTKMMVEILDIKQDNKVMDLATGSAGFLISAMETMIVDAEKNTGKESTATKTKIENIKKQQLLGVELNAEMYTLAATNMILRGDGSSNIQKWNTFDTPAGLYENFRADRILLNPPFSFRENGMPFIEFGLSHMISGWFGAIIIQDSAGSGKAIMTNKKILKNHTLLASIKMPTDLFQPMAGVQTSIYIFQVGTPHDFEKIVKFIDFRNDGYKRTSRSLQEIDHPTWRYEDIIRIYKAWKNAKNLKANWALDQVYREDFITESGADWNYDQHQIIDTTPTLADFKKTVSDYLAWEVSKILQNNDTYSKKSISPRLQLLEATFKENGGSYKDFRVGDLFNIRPTKNYWLTNTKLFEISGSTPVVVNSSISNWIGGYVNLEPTEKWNTITFSDTTTADSIFFQPNEFIGYSHIQWMYPFDTENWTKNSLRYFCVSFRSATKSKFDYWNKFNREKAREIRVSLPVLNGKIAFAYMIERIEELEAERIEELEAYLLATGLSNYTLTKKEQGVLKDFENSGEELNSVYLWHKINIHCA